MNSRQVRSTRRERDRSATLLVSDEPGTPGATIILRIEGGTGVMRAEKVTLTDSDVRWLIDRLRDHVTENAD